MKLILSFLLCAAAFSPAFGATRPTSAPPPASAAPAPLTLLTPGMLSYSNSLVAAPDGERTLFIVDHSSSMKKLAPAAHDAVARLIYGGVNGRMTNGDSYGIWTVSAKPQIGVFPMQVWDRAHPLELASIAGNYLNGVPIDGRANFTDLLNMLHTVVTAVGDLNVLIVTDGETLFKGSPADEELNRQLKAKGKEARRAGKPLIVTLATREGRVAGFSVTPVGEPITLPARPPRIVAKPEPAPPVEKRASRSIIITNAPPKSVAVVAPPPTAPEHSPSPIVAAPAVPVPPPAPAPAEKPATENLPAAEPSHPLAAHLAPPRVPVAPVRSETPAATPAITNTPEPAPDDPDKNPPTLEKIPVLEPLERPTSYSVEARPAAEPVAPAPAAEPSRFATLLEKKMLVFARESGSNRPASPLPAPAAAVPTASWDTPVLVILGSALLVVALVLLWLILRQQRRTTDSSLISRSMERR